MGTEREISLSLEVLTGAPTGTGRIFWKRKPQLSLPGFSLRRMLPKVEATTSPHQGSDPQWENQGQTYIGPATAPAWR